MAILAARSASSSKGGTGRIRSRMVPNRPKTSQRSLWRKRRPIVNLVADIRLILLGVITVAIHPVDPGQDLRHRRIKLSRNFATYLAIFEHDAGQGLVFQD